MTRSPSQLQAVSLAIAGFTAWVFADASLKLAGSSPLPGYELLALLGLFQALILVLWSAPRRELRLLLPRDLPRQFLRSCLDLANNLCVVVAVRHLPLALFYILVFLAPITTSLVAAAFLGERLHWKQGVAILTGFAGVVLAVNPFHAVPGNSLIGYAACLVCVLCFSANIVWSRVITQAESSQSLICTSGLVQAAFGALCMLVHREPVTLHLAGILFGTAICCMLGSLCFFLALRSTTAATVSQFHYTQLLTGSLVAWLGWHEKPTLAMAAGAVLIVGSGIYTAAQAHRATLPVPSGELTPAPQ